MSLNIYTGNLMEGLMEQLGDILDSPLPSALEKEVIVVQSKGMQRWLAMGLSRRNGVWANCEFPFPNKLLGTLLSACDLKMVKPDPFDPAGMTWRIMRICSSLIEKPEFGELKGYLHGGKSLLKSFQLAGKIADTFDQYTIFRADMLKEWESGGGSGWQPILWRALLEETGGAHKGKLQEALLAKLASGDFDKGLLPSRIAVFGISSLPQFHLNVLAALSSIIEVNMFVLSPCRLYWADLVSPRAAAKLPKEEREMAGEGHPLLASLGRLGRDFSRMILDLEDVHGGERDLYSAMQGEGLLADLQNGVLDLRESGGEKRPVKQGDRSLQIHSCHSPMREVEVLHDHLLHLFDTLEGLTPKDILVMTPEIETYAPYVTAVFDSVQDRRRRIPFSIADRSLKREGEVAKTLLAIVEMAGGRFTAPEVMDILASPPVSRMFEMSDGDIEAARLMLQDTRVCWGMDEKDRAKLGLPPYRDHSWKSGFDRLLLGYALPTEGLETFDGIFPYDNMEGGVALILGKLVTFAGKLHQAVESLKEKKRLGDWAATLGGILKTFFKADDSGQREVASIKKMLDELSGQEELTLYHEEVGLDVIASWLEARLGNTGKGFGYMNGGVTFCAMLPMRSIPFRVVVLLGMNDGAFPRQDRPPGFDCISQGPRRLGDRSLREEDRYLFLEALLSARDVLYISYTGQSLKDNSTVPPSVLVSELMDYLDKSYAVEGGELEEELVTEHRLQPFNTEYFDGTNGLFSYSAENLAAAANRQVPPPGSGAFIERNLPAPPDELREVTIAGLMNFFANPAKHIVNARLGIRLEGGDESLMEREPFDIDGLDCYAISQEVVALELEGKNGATLLPVARSRGQLPPGRKGNQEFESIVEDGTSLAERVKALCGGAEKLAPLDVDLRIGDFTIRGRISDIWADRLIRYRSAKLGGKDIVKIWIEHLVLNCLGIDGYPLESALVMKDDVLRLGPTPECASHLSRLLSLYWEGLHRPLKFFPKSSLEYADSGKLNNAAGIWNHRKYPEKDDLYFNLCFGGIDPLDEEFMATAQAVFSPCLASKVVVP